MNFEDTFCPSLWFHMRITSSGDYEYCRWADVSQDSNLPQGNIKSCSVTEYFQNSLAPIRQQLLNGSRLNSCSKCYIMEQHGKVSGRERQLLKVGVQPVYFSKSLASSPLVSAFDYSQYHQGHTLEYVQDWQIDLGNFCNSACVFCDPKSSSKLATEFKKLDIVSNIPGPAWSDNVDLVNKFCCDILSSKTLRYLHFIGGETLITPAFRQMLNTIVNSGRANEITVGFTTNLTVWDQGIIELLSHFKQVNVGVSIETFTTLNDYVRWPSNIEEVKKLLTRWQEVCKNNKWLIQLRITPTCLTIHELITVLDYAWEHLMPFESCDFLTNPKHLKINVLPLTYREPIIKNLELWVDKRNVQLGERIVNSRHIETVQEFLIQEANSYIHYLKESPDDSSDLPALVEFLKLLEKSRKNSIINYIPQYEKLFRASGY
jgi:sulfatase maturation enzyme AslB (radical SAM superfamily)